jgi:L-methionine (R)-S-oxide reductase
MTEKQKQARYTRIYDQLKELMLKCENPISRMATIASILHHKTDYFYWTGFYLLNNDKLLVGPYQGMVACMELEKNKGVCWAGVNKKQTIIVPDVHQFPGHIACDPRSKSEIVVPVFNKVDKVIGVLDVDSKDIHSFDMVDATNLESIVKMIF